MRVEIDPKSGFCFGVVRAIRLAERQLATQGSLLCLGEIVHNGEEVERLKRLGLDTVQAIDASVRRESPQLPTNGRRNSGCGW